MKAAPLPSVDDMPGVPRADQVTAGRPVAQVADIMTPVPITADATTSVDEAARLMLEHGVTGLPVMHGGLVVGVVTHSDLLRALIKAPRPRDAARN
jgi:CBS domain-containing protein